MSRDDLHREGYLFCRVLLWSGFILFSYAALSNVWLNYALLPNAQLDEQAHISYALYFIDHPNWWPDFNHFPMYDITNHAPLSTTNYLNHPPTFYWLSRPLHALFPALELFHLRAIPTAMMLISMMAYAYIGAKLSRHISTTLIYSMLPFLLYGYLQTGFFSNDAAALLGGMIATYASLQWFTDNNARRAYWLMLLGLALASVKLTGLLLVGVYVAACFLMAASLRHRLRPLDYWLGTLTLAIIALPYLYFILHYGSPAPETLGQAALIAKPTTLGAPAIGKEWVFAPNRGWIEAAPLEFGAWLATFLANFTDQLSVREITFLPLVIIMIAFTTILLTHRSRYRQPTQPLTQISWACLIATFITLSIHATFSWGRYKANGWMLDSFIRYYFPLLAAYGIVCINFVLHLLQSYAKNHDQTHR